MESNRWKAEEYTADFRHVFGIINQFFPAIIDKLKLNINDMVMEIGVGSGKWSAAFAIIGCNVVCVDNNEAILNNMYINFPQISKAMIFVKDDVRTLLRIPNKTFQLVFSEGLVEHFLDKKERIAVISNMFNKTKPNGYCLCLVPAQNKADDEIYYDTPEQLTLDFTTINAFETVDGFELKNNGNNGLRFFGVLAKRGTE